MVPLSLFLKADLGRSDRESDLTAITDICFGQDLKKGSNIVFRGLDNLLCGLLNCKLLILDCPVVFRTKQHQSSFNLSLACGKLAQNLESLVETTDYWLSNTTRTTSPRLPKAFEGSEVPTVYTNSIVANGTQSKTETANHHQGVLIVANDGAPEENTPPLFQDVSFYFPSA